jgi:two-component system, sporulation sensor kinase D
MEWTDRIRQMKIFFVVAAILIAVVSLIVSHSLTTDLEDEERNKMEVWSEAMRTLNKADENTDLNLVLKVLNENNTIPVIVLDKHGDVQTFRNVSVSGKNYEDSLQHVAALGQKLLSQGRNIRIQLGDSTQTDYIDVCYEDSLMLKRLACYPFVQLGVVLIFVVIGVFALLTSKRAEQNKVWVGLSKETAHQLGTPISSLMAWVEVLKEMYPNDELIPEMDKDVQRLQLIADRFSKIGSVPELVPSSLEMSLDHVIDYMDKRTSRKIHIEKHFPDHTIMVNLNAALFEWVLENLMKNAVDAMGGEQGRITVNVTESGKLVLLDVSDTGKGIRRKDIGNVFRPGFTTKKRGWGLGLSLAKRIVEQYHQGRIYVKSSEVGQGTTFRIELKSLSSAAKVSSSES